MLTKKATNRLQDKLDVEQLSKVNKKHPENLQQYQPGDKVKDIWGKVWTILKRHDDRAPIKYDVEEEKDEPLNQTDIESKSN